MVNSQKGALTGSQLRAARALLGLTADELAQETKLGVKTIRRAEQQHGPVMMTEANTDRVISALELRGVVFIFEGSEGVGARVRTAPPPRYGQKKKSGD